VKERKNDACRFEKEPLPTLIRKGAPLVPGTVKLLFQRKKKISTGISRLDLKPAPDEC
jgi:hypothetical protein